MHVAHLSNYATISWDNINGETGYVVYTNGELWTTTGADNTNVVDNNDHSDMVIIYSVFATNSYGLSAVTSATGDFKVPSKATLLNPYIIGVNTNIILNSFLL